MFDNLGDRIKSQYEDRTRYYLPRRTFTILRLDQKCGHSYTRGLDKPFDLGYMGDMGKAVTLMLPEIQGAVFAYLQSDEINILLTDFATPTTSAWFDGNLQKMVSVASSVMTAEFNRLRLKRWLIKNADNARSPIDKEILTEMYRQDIDEFFKLAHFDCRAFTIPDRIEVMNAFRWRQQDCIRNSVSMVAQYYFSHKELQGKGQAEMHEMLHQKDINWATMFSEGEKNGRIILKEEVEGQLPIVTLSEDPLTVKRTAWVVKDAWVFTKDEGKLLSLIPNYE